MDVTCAWCAEPWDVYGLRQDGWEYLSGGQAANLDITSAFHLAGNGDKESRRLVSQCVYENVLSGKGCPSETCGFAHGPGHGPYRQQQVQELVFDGVTDDDPMMFL